MSAFIHHATTLTEFTTRPHKGQVVIHGYSGNTPSVSLHMTAEQARDLAAKLTDAAAQAAPLVELEAA